MILHWLEILAVSLSLLLNKKLLATQSNYKITPHTQGSKKQTALTGTEVEWRSEERSQGWQVAIITLWPPEPYSIISKTSIGWVGLHQTHRLFSTMQTRRLEQALEPSSGLLWSTHHFSWTLPHRGFYPWPGWVCLTPAEPWERARGMEAGWGVRG